MTVTTDHRKLAALCVCKIDDPAWVEFTETLQLPRRMVTAVIWSVRHRSWDNSSRPLEIVRDVAVRRWERAKAREPRISSIPGAPLAAEFRDSERKVD